MTSYLIECSFRILGCKRFETVSRDCDRTGKTNTVWDIATGQVENVNADTRVIAYDLEDRTSWDATAEIAEEVAELCMTEYGRIPERLRDWIDEHVGLRAEAAE